MPWCPKCQEKVPVLIQISTSGMLHAGEDVDVYPEMAGCEADLDDLTTCLECEFEGKLEEFQKE